MSEPEKPTPRRGNYAWMGYFAFLIVASVGVTVFMIYFNLSIQLKPEQLETARALWKEKGPKSYNMVYTKKIGTMDHVDKFAVQVRKGIVIEVKMNDKPLTTSTVDGEEHDPRIYHSMDNILRDLDRFMNIDQKPNANRVYVVANFDDKTGAVLRYIRYDMKSKERVELNIMPLAVVAE